MATLARPEATATLREISDEMATLRLGEPSVIPSVLPRIRALLEVENLVVYCPSERLVGWGLERLDHDNLANGSRFSATLRGFLEHAPFRFAFYNPIEPEAEQRDRVVEAVSLVDGEVFRASGFYREVLAPLGLERHLQLRALVCEETSLLAWVGSFHDGLIHDHQLRSFTALLPVLRKRLSIERLLQRPRLIHAAHDLILDQIGDPAFLLGQRGELVFANRAGRTLLDRERGQIVETLQRIVDGTRDIERVNVVPLTSVGVPPCTLVVLRRDTEDQRIEQRVDAAARRWDLTPRQRDVLRHLVRGHGNTTIAELLGIGERAVELHVTAMFDRAGLESRSSLVARVLLMP